MAEMYANASSARMLKGEGGEGGKRDFQGKQALLETILHEATFDEVFVLQNTQEIVYEGERSMMMMELRWRKFSPTLRCGKLQCDDLSRSMCLEPNRKLGCPREEERECAE